MILDSSIENRHIARQWRRPRVAVHAPLEPVHVADDGGRTALAVRAHPTRAAPVPIRCGLDRPISAISASVIVETSGWSTVISVHALIGLAV
jgi:hypothetical protein